MSAELANRIQNNAKYHELVAKRNALGWTLSAIVLFMYFGFTLMIAYTPGVLTQPISEGSVIPVGMLIGVGIIVASCILTGIYVFKANSEFDPIIKQLLEEATA